MTETINETVEERSTRENILGFSALANSLAKDCNHLTWEDVYTIVKEKGTSKDREIVKEMIRSGESLFKVRAWIFHTFIEVKTSQVTASDWKKRLLEL